MRPVPTDLAACVWASWRHAALPGADGDSLIWPAASVATISLRRSYRELTPAAI